MKKKLAIIVAAVLMLATLAGCGSSSSAPASAASTPASSTAAAASDLNIAVFYYNYSDVYISSVRNKMDEQLNTLGVTFNNYDGAGNQAQQTDQINTAITNGANLLVVNIVETSSPDAAQNAVDAAKAAGIPIIFFNREVTDDVVKSYDKCAFVGTDAAEAGHMQGTMIADYLLANYDAVDLNGDGVISYVMFKGQEGNKEAEYRTQYSVEDADKALVAAGKAELAFYDANNASKYLVDQNGSWSAAAATNYMDTILAEYSEANGNMIEVVIANNDDMAQGAISSLQTAGYNLGTGKDGKTIPVFGVDATDSAKQLINEGKMTGTIKQDAEGMANGIAYLAKNIQAGKDLMADTDSFNISEKVSNKIYIPYATYTGE